MRAALLSLLAGLWWLALPVASDAAEPYRYPTKEPVLSVVWPEEWTVSVSDGPAQFVLCSPPEDSTYIISVMTLPTVGGKSDLGAMLTRITRTGAEGSGMTNVTVSNATEGRVGKGVRLFTKVTATGKHNDEDSAFTYYAFTLPGTGKSYAIGVAGLQAMIDAHKADFEAVVDSITPVR